MCTHRISLDHSISELAAVSPKVSAAAEAIEGECPVQISPKLGQVADAMLSCCLRWSEVCFWQTRSNSTTVGSFGGFSAASELRAEHSETVRCWEAFLVVCDLHRVIDLSAEHLAENGQVTRTCTFLPLWRFASSVSRQPPGAA